MQGEGKGHSGHYLRRLLHDLRHDRASGDGSASQRPRDRHSLVGIFRRACVLRHHHRDRSRSPVYGFPGADLHGGLRDLRGAPRMHRLVDWLQKEKRQTVFQLFSSGSHIPLGADSYCDDPSAHQAVHRGDGHCKDRHCSDGDYQFRGYGDLFQCI